MLSCVLLTLLFICTPTHAQPQAQPNPPRPNIILMLADDLAYNDLSCYGSERNQTPRLDQMAAEGVRLTSFYAGASVCTPSRMALLSGSYPARLGWTGGVVGHLMPPKSGMSPDVVTLAELFRGAGYRTAMVGKWHLGDGPLLPMHQGFEESFYLVASNNMSRDLYRNEQLLHKAYDNRLLSQAFTDEVIRQISLDSDKPFFLYVPFTAPHFPAEAHPDWAGHSTNSAYGDVVEELDARVGQILDTLKHRGIDNNTVVLFLSDNGPEGGQSKFNSAAPFNGRKWHAREGGHRVPAILRFPAALEPGRVSDAFVATLDLYPTLAHLCNIPLNLPDSAQKIDGQNVWAAITGHDPAQSRHELLFYHGKGKPTAIRQGDWKLFFDTAEADPDTTAGPLLYHLPTDPGETTDLSAQHPEKVADLQARAQQILADIDANSLPLGRSEE